MDLFQNSKVGSFFHLNFSLSKEKQSFTSTDLWNLIQAVDFIHSGDGTEKDGLRCHTLAVTIPLLLTLNHRGDFDIAEIANKLSHNVLSALGLKFPASPETEVALSCTTRLTASQVVLNDVWTLPESDNIVFGQAKVI